MRKDLLTPVTLLWVAGFFLCANTSSAQEVRMTVGELFNRVEQANIDVRIARRNVDISAEEKKSAMAGRLPDIGVSAEASYLGDATVLGRDLSDATRSPMPHLGNALSLSLYQPLYAGGEISASIEKAENKRQTAENELKLVSDKTKMEVLECYLDLSKHRNLLAVYDENIDLTRRLLEEMRARAEQGLALSNDVTRYELNLSNLSYDRLTVTDGIDHLNRNLLTYLDLDEGTSVIPVLHFEDAGDKDSSPDIWMEQTRLHSPELKQADLDYELAQTEEKILRSSRLPRIGLTAGDNFEGPITNRSPVLDKNLNRWWVGVQLSFNLSSLYKERGKQNAAKMESARQLERRKSREDDLDRRIDRACKYYKEACEQVRTQEVNVKLATENYRIVERRYSNDLSLLTDMLDASTQKLDAEVRLVNARTNVTYYYYQLKYISGTL